MLQRFWHKARTFWPFAALLAIEAVIIAANYHPQTFLMGWDNVMPEFNIRQALITNIFGAWQEHRGLGLPDGMGHAANLIHTVLIWFLSFSLPPQALRYAFHFLMHLTGMVGMYLLLKRALRTSGAAFLGALAYGLGLDTIQMFYTPLEAFSAHYAALPWLAYGLSHYLTDGTPASLLLFGVIALLTTPQYFIPTLMLPAVLLLIFIALPHIRTWRRIITSLLVFFCINAFWLLPYLVNLPHNAPIIQSAKINQMSSGEVYARNQVFGHITDVLSMRGFMLNFEDVSTEGQPIYVMQAWKDWISQPQTVTIHIILAALTCIGIYATTISALRRHHNQERQVIVVAAVGTWLLSLLLLANNTPILSSVMGFLRDRVPLFAEAYRFPFTKFALLYIFSASVLLAAGIGWIQSVTRTRARHLVGVVIGAVIIIQAIPVFQGNLFYSALRISLPKDYVALFSFMDKQDHDGRVAYLPQPSYWSWKHYNYGYVGSGFLWYGLSQPLLDRAFDPWSNTNENYYWELSYALYRKDPAALAAVFDKYTVRYIILDGYLWAPGHDRALFTEESRALLSNLPDTRLIKSIGALAVYERTDTPRNVRIVSSIPSVSPQYGWTDNDAAYRNLGDYTSGNHDTADILYPFRSLFTKRAITEREFAITADSRHITLAATDPYVSTASATIDTTKDLVYTTRADPASLTPREYRSCGFLSSHSKQTAESNHEGNDTYLRLTSLQGPGCLSFGVPALLHSSAYLAAVTTRHTAGRPLMLSFINETAKHVEEEVYLPETPGWQTSYFILPPLAPDGLGYSLYVANESFGDAASINDIAAVSLYTLPYETLSAEFSGKPNMPATVTAAADSVIHTVPASYLVTVPDTDSRRTIVVSQTYNTLWRAYDVTGLPAAKQSLGFIFGTPIPTHALINNWENGWEIQQGQTSILVLFLPQLLEYAGFGLLIIFFLYAASSASYRNTHRRN